ncbi:hypothetical protein PR001_g29319 [Phytophthora rubi]|uniref:Uncharacterized protein n=1 Tax=Phytophthora rubi TaxID=129364 RepID=A0A6A3H363_9STRA|nr:hypothetical protein PR002_g29279 [Phytophthora rubi]KAE8963614.1 hypothetical protein PR001_g29319 [Phytophthora rubi]
MGDAIIRGMQSSNKSTAYMRHWMVYTKTPTGHNKNAVTVSDYGTLNDFLPPFKTVVEAGSQRHGGLHLHQRHLNDAEL